MRGGATEPTKPDSDTIATPRRPTAPNGHPAGLLAAIPFLTAIAASPNPLRLAPVPHISAFAPSKAVAESVTWSLAGLFKELIDSVRHSLGGIA